MRVKTIARAMATKCTQLTDEIKSGHGNYTERNCVKWCFSQRVAFNISWGQDTPTEEGGGGWKTTMTV